MKITNKNKQWIEVNGMNIKSDRNALAEEHICAFVFDANNGQELERITFRPTPTQGGQYDWPKHFADQINRLGQHIRAGEKNSADGFDTIYSGYLNKLWKPFGEAVRIFSTSCALINWMDNGQINSYGDLLPGTSVIVRVVDPMFGATHETLTFVALEDEAGRFVWPYKLSNFINKNSRLIRAGEKNNESKLITPLYSGYRNKLWTPDGSGLTINLEFQVSEQTERDADAVCERLKIRHKASPPDSNEIEKWLTGFRQGRFADIQYPPVQAGGNTAPLYSHISRVKAIGDFAMAMGDSTPAVYIQAGVEALDFYASQNYQTSNWWDRQIGLAKPASVAAVLLAARLKDQQLLSSFLPYIMRTTNADASETGANLADFAYIQLLWSAAAWTISRDATYLQHMTASSVVLSSLCFPVARHGKEGGEGISVDYSISQHNQGGKYSQIYSGTYGYELLGRIFEGNSVLSGAFALDKNAFRSLEALFIEGIGWQGYAQKYDFHVCGRAISRGMHGNSPLAGWSDQLLKGESDNREALVELGKRARGDEQNNRFFIGNRVFWVNDYMAHITRDFCLWSKMISNRTVGTESGNGENLKGYYMGAGSYLLSRHGKEYLNIQPIWDWKRIPGTTIEQDPE